MPLADSFPQIFIPVGFAGGLLDRDTGLIRFGWRDYDPEIGRFTAPDPAEDRRGDGDLYDYCVDDPVSHIDLLGLKFTRAAAVAGGESHKGISHPFGGRHGESVGSVTLLAARGKATIPATRNATKKYPPIIKGDPKNKAKEVTKISDGGKTALKDMDLRSMIPLERVKEATKSAAEKYKVPQNVMDAVFYKESRFDPTEASKSSTGKGLGQLLDGTAAEEKVKDVFNPEENADASARYLAKQIKRFGNTEHGVLAYTWGAGNVQRWLDGKIKLPADKAQYVEDILGTRPPVSHPKLSDYN